MTVTISGTTGVSLVATDAVPTAAIQASAVTTAKIADANVTGAKLENSGVTAGSYGSSSAIPAITVDAKGRITSITTNSVTGGVSSVDSATGAVVLSNLSAFTKSLGSSGYQKLPGGLIVQWGGATTSGGYVTAYFPITFPNAICSVAVGQNGNGYSEFAGWNSWATSYVQLATWQSSRYVTYIAIGY